jgi:hypothetical protein
VLLTTLLATAQSINYDIYALKYASLAHPGQAVTGVNVGKDSLQVDFMVWLIKSSDGKILVVDAGSLYRTDEAKGFDGMNYLDPNSMLQNTPIKPEDVTDIILTREHWDKIDYKDVFVKAHLWMQKEDYEYFTKTAWQKGGVNSTFNRKQVKDIIDCNEKGRLTLLNGDNQEIMNGVKMHIDMAQASLPQYVMVKTNASNIVLAPDNVWLYYNLEHITPVPLFGKFDADGYIRGMQRIKNLMSDEKLIVPGQDAVLVSTFPLITEGVIKIK